jgi:hypothetical protein
MMTKKFYSIAASCAFAMAFGLSACSDDSSSVNVHIDSGNEINIDVPTGDAPGDLKVPGSSDEDISSSSNPKSSSSKIDTLRVEAYDSEESGSSADGVSSSSASKEKSSSSETSAKEDAAFINEGWREDCLAKINEYRATEDLEPLTLASEEKQTCADKQSADDLKSNKAHGHFGDCGEFAQNSGPNFNAKWQKNATAVAEYYLKMMWEEEKALVTSGERDPNKSEDYPYIGHYLNMKNTSYTKVACGITLSEDGKTGWFNVDFF